MTSWRATVKPPGERCTQVHDAPGATSVTAQISFGMRGCLISNRLPTARSGPSRATSRVTEAVQSGQRSTSLNTSQTTSAGASISTPQSVIMYQMVHDYGKRDQSGRLIACEPLVHQIDRLVEGPVPITHDKTVHPRPIAAAKAAEQLVGESTTMSGRAVKAHAECRRRVIALPEGFGERLPRGHHCMLGVS